MFAHRFSPDHVDALRGFFAPRKPRHPLLRVAFGLLGLALLSVLLVVGLLVGAAMVVGGLLLRLWRVRGKPIAVAPARDRRVVDGEFRVVGKSALPSGR